MHDNMQDGSSFNPAQKKRAELVCKHKAQDSATAPKPVFIFTLTHYSDNPLIDAWRSSDSSFFIPVWQQVDYLWVVEKKKKDIWGRTLGLWGKLINLFTIFWHSKDHTTN